MAEVIPARQQDNDRATEQVHFCRTCVYPPMPLEFSVKVLDEDVGRWAKHAIVRVLFLFIVLVLWGIAADTMRLDKQLSLTVSMILPVAVVSYWIIRYLRFIHILERDGVPRLPPNGARLQCVASPNDLPPLGESCREMFEPRVYRASYTSKIALKGVALCWIALAVLQLAGQIGNYGLGTMPLLAAAGISLFAFARPVYFRVSPGRLEVLRYGFIRREPLEVEEYDLRHACIVADLHRRRLTVSHSRRKGKDYSILLMPHRREFLHTLFAAALSKQQAPALPRDTL